jgi:CheY-like chemotaxis protein
LKCIVLLADDAEDAREAYALYLSRNGFSVYQLDDGSRVAGMAIEMQPDVIVLDLGMPGLDGWQTTALLRSHPLTSHIPIVILSGYAFPTDEQRALEAGASVFLSKPCSPPVLAEALKQASASCARKTAAAEGTPPPAAP